MVLTIMSLIVLATHDVSPSWFTERAHRSIAAFPLLLSAVALVVLQVARRLTVMERVKRIMLAGAFLFWAVNQFWPDLRAATLFNDIAIVLFVLDICLGIVSDDSVPPSWLMRIT
jgi:hypothetical protein